LGYAAGLSVDALPSLLLAIALSMTYARIPPDVWDRGEMTLAGLLLWMGCLVVLLITGRTILLETLSGLGLMIASLNRSDIPVVARVAKWGTYSLGIYILHVLFLDGLQDIARKVGFSGLWQLDIATFIVTLLACTVVLLLITNNRKVRWLLF
jgi:peptidoglycan/LPS O-acetylase OafA/YrhL